MDFLHALGGVFSLLLVVGVGYLLGAIGWFPPACRKVLPKLVTNVSLPPFLACTIISSISRDNLLHMLWGAIPPCIAMVSLFVLAWLAAKIMRVGRIILACFAHAFPIQIPFLLAFP